MSNSLSETDKLNDEKLLGLALERLSHYDPEELISEEDIKKEFGITPDMLKGWEEVEIE